MIPPSTPSRRLGATALAGVLALAACGEVVTLRNVPPEVEAVAYCGRGDRRYIEVTVRDHESDVVDVDLVIDADGRRVRVAPGATGSGDTGLRSDRDDPPRHRIEWAALCETAGCTERCPSAERPSEISTCVPLQPLDPLELTVYASDGDPADPRTARLTLGEGCLP